MIQTSTNEEEITTVATQSPQRIVRQTVRTVEPEAKGETPQRVYDKKKTIFRFNQIVWLILGTIEVLLAFRIILKVLGANPTIGFTNLVYSITTPLAAPFVGILRVSSEGISTFEWSTIIAAFVYLCLALGLIYLTDLINPITPDDVATQ